MPVKVKLKIDRKNEVISLPAIALRGLVVFPNNVIHFEVGRPQSIAAVEWAMENNTSLFLVAQKDMDLDEPSRKDLYNYGVVAEIKQALRVSDDLVKVLVEGKFRASLVELDKSEKFEIIGSETRITAFYGERESHDDAGKVGGLRKDARRHGAPGDALRQG